MRPSSWRRSTIWAVCHWSPRISTGKRPIATSIASERRRPGGSRIAAALAAAATRTPAAARKSLKAPAFGFGSQAAGSGCRGARCRRIDARRDQRPVLAEQFHPQLVAAGRGDAAAALATVPVEGVEVVALEEAVAGEGDDEPPARLDDLDGGVVGLGDPEADPHSVVAAVAVGGEAGDRVARVQHRGADEGDPVEDQRVALQPLRPGEGGDRGEDEQREDEGGGAGG